MSDYANEHLFLLSCAECSDFNSEVKACLAKESEQLAEDICENLSILSKSLALSANIQKIIVFDADTLNYTIEKAFLERYRSVNNFIETISPQLFECLCAYYLKSLGCNDVKVTRHSNDQGLDFYGILPFTKNSFFDSISEKVFLLGQAKLYKEPVGTNEIRELVGSIELIKKLIYSSKIYSYQFATELKPYTPVNPIFITSSRFSKDAINLCQQIGIRIIDRVKLISLLTTINDLFDNNALKESIFYQEITSVQLAEKNL